MAIAERRVRTRALELQGEEIEDKFRERASKEECEEAERQQAEELRLSQEEQRRLVAEWCEVGMGKLPPGFPLERKAEVLEKLRARLRVCDLSAEPNSLTDQLIDSVIASFVGPWERQEEIARFTVRKLDSVETDAMIPS